MAAERYRNDTVEQQLEPAILLSSDDFTVPVDGGSYSWVTSNIEIYRDSTDVNWVSVEAATVRQIW